MSYVIKTKRGVNSLTVKHSRRIIQINKVGRRGPAGADGIDGTGLPNGGTTGQILTKESNTDGDADWEDAPQSLPDGGTDGQVLTKQSSTDGDADWEDPTGSVTSVNGEDGDVVLDKSDIGLGNVANVDTTTTANITDSSNKRFVNDAERTVIQNTSGTNTGDQDLSGLVPNSRTVNGHALSSDVTVTKSDVGLGNADNTSDANKPVSTAQAAADATVASNAASALSAHEADTTNVHGIADTSALETTTGAQAKADAKVAQTITNGVTTSAPSQDAVFDALALKQDSSTSVNDGDAAGGDLSGTYPNPSVVSSSTTTAGKVELATDAETLTGTDTVRAITPSNLTAKMDTDGTLAGNSDTRIASQKATKTYTDAKVDDTAYAGSWNGVTTIAPTKNAVYDKFESLNLGVLTQLTGGFTAPAGSLDKWKAGNGKLATWVDNSVNASDTTFGIRDAGWAQATLPRIAYIEDEHVLITATSAGRSVTDGVIATSTSLTSATASFVAGDVGRSVYGTGIVIGTYIASVTNSTTVVLSQATTATASGVSVAFGLLATVIRGENGTTAASHSAGTEILRRRSRVITAIGDSIDEGITILTNQSNDSFMDRLHRVLGERYGGVYGKCWGNWRSVAGGNFSHAEWNAAGSVSSTSGTTSEVGFGGTYAATNISGGTGNYWYWTRPAGEIVKAADIFIVDVGAASCAGSYSIDGGTTWVDYPLTTRYSSGTGILRKFTIACDNPTTIRFRGATASGTSKAIVMPSVPLVTYSNYPYNITDGLSVFNLGWGGVKLRQTLNSRTSTDAVVTNGSATVTSATAAFVAADDESTVYLNGVSYQIDSVTNGTTIVLKTNYAGTTATGVRITIFQGDHTGDRLASVIGHAGSFRPDLCIIGTCSNDQVVGSSSLGDGNENAYYDLYTYIVGKIKPYSDVLILVPHERNTATITSPVQAAFRAMAHTVATEQGVAVFDIYDSMAANGYTGYAAANAKGWIADGTHLSESGNQFFAGRLIDMLEFA